MEVIKIEGGRPLNGTVRIDSAKNSTVALIPAAILADSSVILEGVPQIVDVEHLGMMIEQLNGTYKIDNDELIIDPTNLINTPLVEGAVNKLRASYYFMGALLGKFKEAVIGMPGGCYLGPRPIDLHLKGFEALGATITQESGAIRLKAEKLTGAKIYLDFASVGATINIMLAAVKAEGTTIIENAAKEPEIIDLANLLNSMGAKIKGAGTSIIKIEGVKYLHKCFTEVIPDRIEAGTYLIIGALLGENLKINKIIPSHLESLISKLKECGAKLQIKEDYIIVNRSDKYKPLKIKTQVYPGYPTDLQQIIVPLLTQCNGISRIEETIYENRFQNIKDTNKMGAKIEVIGNKNAIISGPTPLKGKQVSATDLRGGASLVVLGLIAEGTTTISNIEHIIRGYEDIITKLSQVGAKIELI